MNRSTIIIALTEGSPQMSKALATRIVDALYAKGLDAKDFDAILWRLRRKMEKEELAKLMEKATKETIESIIDELVAMRLPCPPAADCCCSEAHFFNELHLSEGKEYKAGDVLAGVEILRTGKWKHERYGTFEVTTKALSEFEKNFKDNVRGIKIFADEDHEPTHKALAEFTNVKAVGKRLLADLKLTAKGAKLLTEGAYHYFSSEFARVYRDIETGKQYSNLLLGGAFTNRPVIKGMAPILASETGTDGAAPGEQANAEKSASILLLHSPSKPMLKFLDLLDSFVGKEAITASEKAEFEEAWAALSEEQREIPEYKAKYDDVMALKLAEDGEEDEGDDTDSEEEDGEETEEGGTPKEKVKASERKPAKKPSKKKAVTEDEPLELSEREELKQLREEKRQLSHRENAIRLSEANDRADEIFADVEDVQLSPASKKALANFAVSLSEKQEEKLWSILEDMKLVMLGELGYGKDDDGNVVLSEEHPAVVKLMGAGYELSEAQDIAAEALKLKKPVAKAKK